MAKHSRNEKKARRKRSGAKGEKATVAKGKTKNPPQKPPIQALRTAVIVTKPRTRQQTSQENTTKVRLGKKLFLTGPTPVAKAEDGPSHNRKPDVRSRRVNKRGRKACVSRDLHAMGGRKSETRESGQEEEDTSNGKHSDEDKAKKGKREKPISRSALLQQLKWTTMALEEMRAEAAAAQSGFEEKRIELDGALSFLNRYNSSSGAEVISLANALNAEILQGAAYIADMPDSSIHLADEESAGYKRALRQAHMSLGRDLADALTIGANWGSDKFVVQIALQVCMVTFCANVIHSWSSEESEGRVLAEIYRTILTKGTLSIF